MKNRLTKKVEEAKKTKKKLFCAFLTLGYPNLRTTEKLIRSFERKGVDIIELGFPFSDPMADGPTIQFSSEEALRNKVKIENAFSLVKKLRESGCNIPIIFFSYLNPIHAFGKKKFAESMKNSGFDGLIVPDLPPEEEKDLGNECKKKGISQIFLIAPTTPLERARTIAKESDDFIYYVSLKGVTGVRQVLPKQLKRDLLRLKNISEKPFLVGFGVSTPEQVRSISKIGYGVIVGSAIINELRKAKGSLGTTERFIGKLVGALRER